MGLWLWLWLASQKDFLINVWGYERNDDDDNDGDDDDDDMEPYKITCRKTQVQLAAGTVSVRGEHSMQTVSLVAFFFFGPTRYWALDSSMFFSLNFVF